MPRDIFPYEVTMRLWHTQTKTSAIAMRLEHAYGVEDACMQAAINQAGQLHDESIEIVVTHVGPPVEAIRQAAVDLAGQVAAAMKELTKKARKRKKVA